MPMCIYEAYISLTLPIACSIVRVEKRSISSLWFPLVCYKFLGFLSSNFVELISFFLRLSFLSFSNSVWAYSFFLSPISPRIPTSASHPAGRSIPSTRPTAKSGTSQCRCERKPIRFATSQVKNRGKCRQAGKGGESRKCFDFSPIYFPAFGNIRNLNGGRC